jgi:hypothetical protein
MPIFSSAEAGAGLLHPKRTETCFSHLKKLCFKKDPE